VSVLPEIGQVALILALLSAIALGSLPLIGAQRGHEALMRIARPASWVQFLLLAVSFTALTWSFVVQDFSVAYVANNSNSLLPMHYRFSAVPCCCGC
jgi:cytochrome c-type biogenesis protein CcmF